MPKPCCRFSGDRDFLFPLFAGTSPYKSIKKIENNRDYKTVSVLLGHSNISITLNLYIDGYPQHYKPYGFEFTTGPTEEFLIDFKPLRDRNMRVRVNSPWHDHNAGHHDDVALENPDVYDWYVHHHVNIIQTDRIKERVDYLRRKGW